MRERRRTRQRQRHDRVPPRTRACVAARRVIFVRGVDDPRFLLGARARVEGGSPFFTTPHANPTRARAHVVVSFNPTIDTINPIENTTRSGGIASSKSTTPPITVPITPIPTQTA